jgi:hypothetical protein
MSLGPGVNPTLRRQKPLAERQRKSGIGETSAMETRQQGQPISQPSLLAAKKSLMGTTLIVRVMDSLTDSSRLLQKLPTL